MPARKKPEFELNSGFFVGSAAHADKNLTSAEL